jgi:BASS family bile acid:Na+ symporter
MAGNLLEMGLRLNPQDALRGLRNVRFVVLTMGWGFVLGPALAYGITRVLPLATPYAVGLILMGMTPSAPFLPMIVNRAKGDLGYTAAFMLLSAAGTVLFMPFAVPVMVEGLTVSAWAIARPLIFVILVPMAIGMGILRAGERYAATIRPLVKKVTGLFTLAMLALCLLVYGRGLLGVAGSLAVVSQLIFFGSVTTLTYWLGAGLEPDQRIVLSAGMATRNLGAALAPLLAVPGFDQRATVMVVLGLPLTVIFTLLSVKWFGPPAEADRS